MRGHRSFLIALAGMSCLAGPAAAQTASAPKPSAFDSHVVAANGIKLHYVVAGHGEPVLLLPGWPQDWYAWRHVIADLASSGRRVYALDPRGFGDSAKPAGGYDMDTAAADLHAFIGEAGLARAGGIDIVAHDLGAWIAYAHASAYPLDVRRLVLSEVTIPGAGPPKPVPDDATNVKTWHFGFNRLQGLPEALVAGRERVYLTWLFENKSVRRDRIDPQAVNEYVRAFASPGAATAGFNYYRQTFSDAGLKRMRERLAHPLPMPVLTIGAAGGVGTGLEESLKSAASDLHGVVLPDCGHYLPDECPAEMTAAVRAFWTRYPGGGR